MHRLSALAAALACSLAAGPALAQGSTSQDVASPAAAAPVGAYVAPETAETPDVAVESTPTPRWHRIRLLGEAATGMLTLGAGAAIGALIGLAAAPECGLIFCLGDPGLSRAATGAVIGAAASTLLVPLTISGAGELHGGRGNAGGAYAGFAIGGLVGAGIIAGGVAIAENCSGWGCVGATALAIPVVVIGVAVTLVSPFIGYEVAHANGGDSPVEAMPTVAVTSDGAIFGAIGAF